MSQLKREHNLGDGFVLLNSNVIDAYALYLSSGSRGVFYCLGKVVTLNWGIYETTMENVRYTERVSGKTMVLCLVPAF